MPKTTIEVRFIQQRVANTSLRSIVMVYSDNGFNPECVQQGCIIITGDENEVSMKYELLMAGEPTPDVRRIIDDLYEGAFKEFAFPRLFGF